MPFCSSTVMVPHHIYSTQCLLHYVSVRIQQYSVCVRVCVCLFVCALEQTQRKSVPVLCQTCQQPPPLPWEAHLQTTEVATGLQ